MKAEHFIVVWDDQVGLCVPQTWDPDCEGALCAVRDNEAVALFTSRAAARAAINISAKNSALKRAQGKVFNDDFAPGQRSNLRILPCRTK